MEAPVVDAAHGLRDGEQEAAHARRALRDGVVLAHLVGARVPEDLHDEEKCRGREEC